MDEINLYIMKRKQKFKKQWPIPISKLENVSTSTIKVVEKLVALRSKKVFKVV